jgi:putative transposase
VPDWAARADRDDADEDARLLRRHEATGRPLGSAAFVTRMEALLQRTLRPQPPGRKKRVAAE